MAHCVSDIPLVGDLKELSLGEVSIKAQKSPEELERLTVDEKLQPIERSVYLLSSGQPVQQISVITALPDLLRENNADCMRRVVPKVREVLHVAQQDMQLAACCTFLEILEKQLLPVTNYSQTFLQTIISSLDNRDPDISKAWLGTLLDVIELLPKDVVKENILNVAIAKGQLSQSVPSRLSCCRILGKVATKFEPFVIKKKKVPVVQSLCQDVDYEVRACMCRELDPVARGLGLDQTKSAILPELVELTNDEKSDVRLAGLDTVVKILSLLDNDTCMNTIIPLVCKFCQHAMIKEDDTLPFVSKQLGRLCHDLQSNLTDEQKKWFVDYFKKLCKLGVKEADRPCNKDPDEMLPKFSSLTYIAQTEFHVVDPTIETRKNAAFNFPAMVLFVGPKSFKSELSASFTSLCCDPNHMVRKSIALGFHEVVKTLGNNCHLLIHDLTNMLQDDSLDALYGISSNLGGTLESIAKCVTHSTANSEAKHAAFNDLIPVLIQCEESISLSNNWRLQKAFMEALHSLPSCFPSDLIFQKFLPLLSNKLLTARALPVKKATGKTILVVMRQNRRLDQRREICQKLVRDLCQARSYYHRCLFIEVCKMVMDDFSKKFFKEYFVENLLDLCSDRVPNVRLRTCALLPRLKKQLQLPQDRNLLQMMETCVRRLLMSETDPDVKDTLDRAVKEFDRVPTRISTSSSLGIARLDEEEQLDQKKLEWEEKLIEMEEKEKEEAAAKAEKAKERGIKATSGNKLSPMGKKPGGKPPVSTPPKDKATSINAGGVRTERSGSFQHSAGTSKARNSPKTQTSTKANGAPSPGSRKTSASSVSPASVSRRSSTGSTPNQEALRKPAIGRSRKISTGSMMLPGGVANRKK